ncbi:TetR/AcrR family transcriptional regulator [Arthrobacter sp. Y81]|uniref:TetR/AcrR family transcriptional regulator n=1 Tax=Arthrobacter sp. Y81 TaxID=2058897 RepID=UPI000CE3A9C0|nr:TetR/AcrR family transcriptional regulator [Arthrobacter sp. Y81]
MTTLDSRNGRRLTARGEKTRARIVAAAADLMNVQGVGATTLDDVLLASGVSKSQLYHHFAGKDALVRAVIDHVGGRVIERERDALGHVSTIPGLRRWRDALVQNNALRHGAYGCSLGSLASEVSDQDDAARRAVSQLFTEWQGLLAGVLRRLQDGGTLPPEASIDQLATGLMGALQGGYMLAQTARDVTPMATSIDMALAHIESLLLIEPTPDQATHGAVILARDSVRAHQSPSASGS